MAIIDGYNPWFFKHQPPASSDPPAASRCSVPGGLSDPGACERAQEGQAATGVGWQQVLNAIGQSITWHRVSVRIRLRIFV